ncbi:helix-turn-helix transcriptional regulator [Pseudomonas vanderleydeniana]|uniref:LuxR C-terminal-related transcriptional regulator n=1 Tax=Pseudomonas vanderleydeniana TaxID=2745495 RepID=A0A9E6PFK6_9PSED|nr:LuxR C-terminal-related transcriptional regulator [Pseudomonas vanderleydeniana]QXI25614.1 LuxR C-terminal-related transcriptional regulator [Pseudomonas vanderleydeniana]
MSLTSPSVLRAVGSAGFGPALDTAFEALTGYDMSCAYLFRPNAPAVLLHNGYGARVARSTLEAYQRGGYLLDPFYVAAMNRHPAGLWRMSELAPDSFFASGFAISPDIHPCVASDHGVDIEEIGYIAYLDDRAAVVFSLMRGLGGGGFSQEQVERLAPLADTLAALFELHLRLDSSALAPSGREEDTFIALLQRQLTETQAVIARLILQGHSSVSIAANLGISEGTVKVHRHNLYQRLNISTHAELFRLFIDFLTTAEPGPG